MTENAGDDADAKAKAALLRTVAFHEAGHTAAALELGFAVTRVNVIPDGQRNTLGHMFHGWWDHPAYRETGNSKRFIMLGIAGRLAQMIQDGGMILDEREIRHIIDGVLTGVCDSPKRATSDFNTMLAYADKATGGHGIDWKKFINEDASEVKRAAQLTHEVIKPLIRETAHLLQRPEVWKGVVAVAHALEEEPEISGWKAWRLYRAASGAMTDNPSIVEIAVQVSTEPVSEAEPAA